MKAFLGIVSKKTKLNPDLYTKVESVAARSLSCIPEVYQSETWNSESGRIVIFNWTNEPTIDEGEYNLWDYGKDSFTMTGYINKSMKDFLNELINRRTDSEKRKLISETGGLYAMCYVDGKSDTITLWNTITRIEPIYWTENSDYIIVSSRALLAHLLCENSKTPNYDLNRLGSFINMGYFVNDYTPFKNINILSPNKELKISPSGIKIESIDGMEEVVQKHNMDSKFYDDLTETLVESFYTINANKNKLRVSLTGGKDSRIIAAALKYTNANFETFTNGFKDNPEVVIASRISEILKVPHTAVEPTIKKSDEGEYIVQDILARTRSTLFVTDGMMSGYENITKSNHFVKGKVKFGGQGGELLREEDVPYLKTCDPDELRRILKNKYLRYPNFMQNESLELFEKDLECWVKKMFDTVTANDIVGQMRLYYLAGRWSAAARHAATSCCYLCQPFFDGKLIKLVQRVPYEKKTNDELIYNLLKRLAPELVNIPFYAKRWRFEENGPRQGEELLWKQRTPLMNNQNAEKSTFNWRLSCLEDMKDAFYDEIFNSSVSNDIFTIIKKDKLEAIFKSNIRSGYSELIWGIYTISVLISNKWIDDNNLSKIVKIKVPNK